MAVRERPEVVASRCTLTEKRTIEAAAEAQGVTVSEFIHRVLVPVARKVLIEATSPELV